MTESEACAKIIQYIRDNDLNPQVIELLRMSVNALSFAEKISDICGSRETDFENEIRTALLLYKQDMRDEVYLWNHMKEQHKK